MAKLRPKHASTKHISKLIEQEVSWFNGWNASEESVQKSCKKAALKIRRYLRGWRIK